MNFQIKDIVLYNSDGKKRILTFNLGKLNIITGGSKTGKTALITIIDYCLGKSVCNIPEGVIRKSVVWYGLRVKLSNGEIFLARKKPDPGKLTSSEIYFDIKNDINIPKFEDLHQTTNTPTLISLLTKHVGIGENIYDPLPNQTRRSLKANFRHSLFFTFQQQDEIINRYHLFHRQSEQYIPQTIKDVLPYFLGAMDEEHVEKKANLQNKKKRLRGFERKLKELESIRGEGISKAHNLFSEAKDIGIYNKDKIPKEWDDYISILKDLQKMQPEPEKQISKEGDEYEKLHLERVKLIREFHKIRDEIDEIKNLVHDKKIYSLEAYEQLIRLRSINIFENETSNKQNKCPLCNSIVSDDHIPSIQHIKNSINQFEKQMRDVDERSQKMDEIILKLEEQEEEIKEKLIKNREAMEVIQASNIRIQEIRDRATRRAHILGRISLYLESLPQLEKDSDLQNEISILNKEISALEEDLSYEQIEERVDSITSIISKDITEWAKRLKLEHSKYPLRLNVKKLQIGADTPDGVVPMYRMGSGENWVGYHLISHLALHSWFVIRNRPVPRFLFIDQPSQVYFPADKDFNGNMNQMRDEDRQAVKRMYKLTYDVVEKLSPNFQIIITDHADIDEDWFQKNVIERWRGGRKLIPEDWYS